MAKEANVLLVVAPEVFRDEELFDTREELVAAGHNVTIASSSVGECTGKLGGTVNAQVALSDVQTSMFDAVSFIGGNGCSLFFGDHDAVRIIGEMYDQHKLVSAICLAPMILARNGFLKGKRVSVTDSQKQNLADYGALYAGAGVVVDGNTITADGPESAHEFGKAIVELLAKV